MLYTWDFKTLVNTVPEDGSEKIQKVELVKPRYGESAPKPAPHSMVALGLLEEEVTSEKDGWKEFWVITRKLSPRGLAWVKAVYANLEERYPVSNRCPAFYMYTSPGKGNLVIYDFGVDMMREWPVIFGRTAAMYTEVLKLSDDYRPWTCQDIFTPTMFIDSQREDYAWTDSMGAPVIGGEAQAFVDMMYCLCESEPSMLDSLLSNISQRFAGLYRRADDQDQAQAQRVLQAFQCFVQPEAA
tara:strand:- start:700 stop:1425 length:726 start_codon:yes stop_codon:yes gene_type:complete